MPNRKPDDEPPDEIGVSSEELREERRRVSTGLYLSWPKVAGAIAVLFVGGVTAAGVMFKLNSSIERLTEAANTNWTVTDAEMSWERFQELNETEYKNLKIPNVQKIYRENRRK